MEKINVVKLKRINGGMSSPKACGISILQGALGGMAVGATGGVAGLVGGANAGAVIGTLGCFKK